MSEAQGGKFINGFASGALSSVAASFWQGDATHRGISGFLGAKNTVGTVLFGAIAGGAGADFTGGNFWQGAVTGGIVAYFNHSLHDGGDGDDNGYDKNGNKINDKGGDTTDYLYDDNGKIIESKSVFQTHNMSQGEFTNSDYENFKGYGYKVNRMATGAIAEDNTFFELYSGGKAFSLINKGLTKLTGGLKQWIRIDKSYSFSLGQKTSLSIKWGAGANHWKKIGNPTLQNLNKSFRQTKLPGDSWRVNDPGHFHIKK